ncbi:MAG: response regulator [Bacteroidetes bacterium]|nr:response regulator [Bacteroidota bacterium]
MSEELLKKIEKLELEIKTVRLASQQWEHLQKVYQESIDRLQVKERELSVAHERTDRALFGGDLAWWDWEYKTGRMEFNENRSRMLGYGVGELPQTYNEIIRMIHPDDYGFTLERLQGHISGAYPNYEAEFRLKTKSGEWRWFYDKGKIVETDILGKPVRLAGVLIDIHERKSIENELVVARDTAVAESRSKSNFLVSMSHDIYTPMAGVIGMAEILKQSKLSQEQVEYLNTIVKSATNLMSILNDIIEFSKLESGKLEFHEKPFSVHQVIEEVTGSYVEKAHEKGIELLSFQDPNIPVEVLGDPVRLRQIMKIFTDNALKFTEKGEIRIEAHFMEWDNETVKVRFNVCDTGIGISEAGMKMLFTSFAKLDTPESKKYSGGGLGLAIARRLIDRMNGHITVETNPGSGTTFSFNVVFERYKDSEVHDSMKETLLGAKVLIVDPNASRRSILTNYLVRWDAEVLESSSPEEALKLIQHRAEINKPFDLIIVEYQMPGMDGLKFASSMRHAAWMKKSKVLLTNSRISPVSSAELAAAGILVALVRPYTLSRLRCRIREVLSQIRKEFAGDRDEVDVHLLDDQKKMLNILLAEDNLINQKVALVTLEKIGHTTDLAENGKIAVEMFTTKDYDLVLMDMSMPDMDGLEATRQIRQIEAGNPGRNPVHICAITANTSPEDEERCYQAGMDSYISKPFKLEELVKILNRI